MKTREAYRATSAAKWPLAPQRCDVVKRVGADPARRGASARFIPRFAGLPPCPADVSAEAL
ncbi:MAG: hypothetical protein L6437_13490 [Kiritimatiellae bacterium]|nr:hypothetical protein [Verrucomicrobiota bacterium]MBU4366586.1 hypothetical protein [Verrucomicrobiota bacterium]MCG2661245.1 hypothetical protein [Kiritimatiellia bacterium]